MNKYTIKPGYKAKNKKQTPDDRKRDDIIEFGTICRRRKGVTGHNLEIGMDRAKIVN